MKEAMYQHKIAQQENEIKLLKEKLVKMHRALKKEKREHNVTTNFAVGMIIFMIIALGLFVCYLMG